MPGIITRTIDGTSGIFFTLKFGSITAHLENEELNSELLGMTEATRATSIQLIVVLSIHIVSTE